MFQNRRILIGVGGGIAAYKLCEVVSTLAKAGAEVRVILTQTAQSFITPLTLATLSRHQAYTDASFWQADQGRPLHIELGEWAEIFVIAPLTANTLAKLAYGLADNLLTNTVLASTCPILLAPAMNTEMWEQATVQRNWQMVSRTPRFHTVGPGAGLLACDLVGAGRMAEPIEILAHLESLLQMLPKQGQLDLAGKRILISTGGTREYLDPVRFIGNPSTGRMGVALALAAKHRGATVTLVHGPMEGSVLEPLGPIRRMAIVSSAEMDQMMQALFPDHDWTIMAAAVADVKPTQISPQKLPKRSLPDKLALTPVPDIVAGLSLQKEPHQRLVGFAAQSGDIVTPALEKLQRKHLDVIVANPIDQPDSGFASDRNSAILLDGRGRKVELASASKLQIAHQVLDFILETEEPG